MLKCSSWLPVIFQAVQPGAAPFSPDPAGSTPVSRFFLIFEIHDVRKKGCKLQLINVPPFGRF
jgi:hypothetical protein